MTAYRRAFPISSNSTNSRVVGIGHTLQWKCALIAACACAFLSCQDQRGLPKEALEWSSPEVLSDPFQTLQVEIQGDSLVVQVAYSGGCAEHHFELKSSGPQVRSMPPKQPIALFHQANGDACRARIHERLSFGLHSFRMSPEGITLLLLNDSTLMYRYE